MLEETTVEKKGIKLTVNFDKTDGNSYRKINEITKVARGLFRELLITIAKGKVTNRAKYP